MKILDANEFYDVVIETFPHDVISKDDVLELINEMAIDKVLEPKNDGEYIICYTSEFGDDMWESVCGEDAMHIRVDELVSELGCESEEIMVFNRENELI